MRREVFACDCGVVTSYHGRHTHLRGNEHRMRMAAIAYGRSQSTIEPPAEAQGKWTRDLTGEGYAHLILIEDTNEKCVVCHRMPDGSYRYWSLPLVLPPPPTDASEEEA